jgi:hypothetical protein
MKPMGEKYSKTNKKVITDPSRNDKSFRVKLKQIIPLLRPSQWFKNAFIFLPLFFNGQFGNPDGLFSCTIAFITFS